MRLSKNDRTALYLLRVWLASPGGPVTFLQAGVVVGGLEDAHLRADVGEISHAWAMGVAGVREALVEAIGYVLDPEDCHATFRQAYGSAGANLFG